MGAYATALAAVLDERGGPCGADGLEPGAGGVQLRQRVRGRVVAVLHALTQPPKPCQASSILADRKPTETETEYRDGTQQKAF